MRLKRAGLGIEHQHALGSAVAVGDIELIGFRIDIHIRRLPAEQVPWALLLKVSPGFKDRPICMMNFPLGVNLRTLPQSLPATPLTQTLPL